MYDWTAEQQAIIDRIMSGQTDYTFGPGSPDATPEDMGTYVGGPYSPAGGFAVHGGVALAPKEYNLFSPEERRYLGIMDIGPDKNAGKVERYYASGSPSRGAFMNTVQSPATGGAYADSGQPYDTMGGQYANFSGGTPGAATGTGATQAIGGALANILQNLGKSQSQGTGINPQSLMGPGKPLSWYAPAPFPQLPYT